MTEAASAGSASIFCDDSELGYRRSLTDFSVPLTLDDSYRLRLEAAAFEILGARDDLVLDSLVEEILPLAAARISTG